MTRITDESSGWYVDVSETTYYDVTLKTRDSDHQPDDVSLMAEDAIKVADAIYEIVGVDKPEPAISATENFNEAALRLAADHGKRARFSYDKGDGALETRRLRPDGVWQSALGYPMVGGQDADRGEYRNFRVDRIQGSVVIG